MKIFSRYIFPVFLVILVVTYFINSKSLLNENKNLSQKKDDQSKVTEKFQQDSMKLKGQQITTKANHQNTSTVTGDLNTSSTQQEDELKSRIDSSLPQDLKAQLNAPQPELPEDLKRQLEAPPIELPEDIKRASQIPPREVSIDEVNNPNGEFPTSSN